MNMNFEKGQSVEKKEGDNWRGFAEKLSEVWVNQNPEIETMTVEDLEKAKEEFEDRENAVNDKEITEVLAEYGFDVSSLSIDSKIEPYGEPEFVYRLKVKEHFSNRRLPKGYGYAGGAARALLLRNLGIDPVYFPRDIDVVRLSAVEPYNGADMAVSEQFMPDDFQYGHGVKDESNLEKYFATRDLTSNEVLATDEEIFVTRIGLLDTARHIIRITEFEKAKFTQGVGSKLLTKALRFYVEMIRRYEQVAIEDLDDYTIEVAEVAPFDLAIQLDKAAEISLALAQAYVDELRERKKLPSDVETVEEATQYIYNQWFGQANEFYRRKGLSYRHAPIKQIEIEADWVLEYHNVMKTKSREAIKKEK